LHHLKIETDRLKTPSSWENETRMSDLEARSKETRCLFWKRRISSFGTRREISPRRPERYQTFYECQ
jgi:hypothetical protein